MHRQRGIERQTDDHDVGGGRTADELKVVRPGTGAECFPVGRCRRCRARRRRPEHGAGHRRYQRVGHSGSSSKRMVGRCRERDSTRVLSWRTDPDKPIGAGARPCMRQSVPRQPNRAERALFPLQRQGSGFAIRSTSTGRIRHQLAVALAQVALAQRRNLHCPLQRRGLRSALGRRRMNAVRFSVTRATHEASNLSGH